MSTSWGSGGWGIGLNGYDAVQSLLENLQVQFSGDTVFVVGPNVSYAIYHELGTWKMDARPFMRPAAERVGARPGEYARQVSSSQGIPLNSEHNIVKCVALAVENEAKKIAAAKDIKESGDLIASIEAEEQ